MASKSQKEKVQGPAKVSRKTLLEEHESLKALRGDALPGEKLEATMRRKCREMVAHAKSLGWSGPPYCPIELASIYGIKVEETDEDIGGEGCIFPRRDGVVIRFKSGRPAERQRFTISHELAHTRFSNSYEFVRYHNAEEIEDAAHKKFENLCDMGAGELLLPQDDFLPDLESGKMSLLHMEALRTRYNCSIEVVLKRMLDYTKHSCAAAFMTDQPFKDFAAVQGQMRVQWMWKSDSFQSYLKQGALAPKFSNALARAIDTARPFPSSRETWWINGNPRSWYVEAVRLPLVPDAPTYAKIAALLHSRKP